MKVVAEKHPVFEAFAAALQKLPQGIEGNELLVGLAAFTAQVADTMSQSGSVEEALGIAMVVANATLGAIRARHDGVLTPERPEGITVH